MNKHTPGPWTFDEEMGEVTTPTRIQKGIVEISTVELGWTEPMESEQRANARLIASAPELLTACEVSVFHLESLLGASNPAVIAMRTAIAKATGEA